jgi:DNA-binding CsgD family transcriptional regulator
MIEDMAVHDRARELLARCIRAIGAPGFYRSLLEVGRAVSGAEHLSVFSFSPALEPTIEVLEGLDNRMVTSHSARFYLGRGYHGSDPAALRLRELSPDRDEPAIFVLRADEIEDQAYRRDIYERFDLGGRVSLIGRAGMRWRAVNFYKHRVRGPLAEADVRRVAHLAPLLFAAEIRNSELSSKLEPARTGTVPPLDRLRQLLRIAAPTLSRQEAEVCVRGLQGLTGEATGLDLRISDTTVATLRRRAYAKIGISNLHELFALCLEAARLVAEERTASPPTPALPTASTPRRPRGPRCK